MHDGCNCVADQQNGIESSLWPWSQKTPLQSILSGAKSQQLLLMFENDYWSLGNIIGTQVIWSKMPNF